MRRFSNAVVTVIAAIITFLSLPLGPIVWRMFYQMILNPIRLLIVVWAAIIGVFFWLR